MTNEAAVAKAPQQAHQDSALLRLPAELRLIIYTYAMQDFIDTPPAQGISTLKDYKVTPLYSGALALPLTSHTLLTESLDVLKKLVLARINQMTAEALRSTGIET